MGRFNRPHAMEVYIMVTVHIHEIEQCTEVQATSAERALHDYITHNAYNFDEWRGTTVQYAQDDTTVVRIVAQFVKEVCIITLIPNTTRVYYAKWEEI